MNSINDYSSSSSSEDEDSKVNSIPSMPKLPSFFDTFEHITTDTSGKSRTVPHKKNNWATYVYFQVDLAEDKEKLLNYCQDLEPIEEQHISLTRTLYLKYSELDSFKLSIQKAIEDMQSFSLSFAQVACLTNDENTRSFLTLEVGNGYNQLQQYLTKIDKIMRLYKQPKFYQPPRFHTSIAWSLNESKVKSITIPSDEIDSIISKTYMISRLYIKQGHFITHIDLK